MTDVNTDALINLMRDHRPRKTEEGWIDCSCGWESNHPRLPNEMELSALESDELDDPPYRTGDPDPDHLDNDVPFTEHLARLQSEVVSNGDAE